MLRQWREAGFPVLRDAGDSGASSGAEGNYSDTGVGDTGGGGAGDNTAAAAPTDNTNNGIEGESGAGAGGAYAAGPGASGGAFGLGNGRGGGNESEGPLGMSDFGPTGTGGPGGPNDNNPGGVWGETGPGGMISGPMTAPAAAIDNRSLAEKIGDYISGIPGKIADRMNDQEKMMSLLGTPVGLPASIALGLGEKMSGAEKNSLAQGMFNEKYDDLSPNQQSIVDNANAAFQSAARAGDEARSDSEGSDTPNGSTPPSYGSGYLLTPQNFASANPFFPPRAFRASDRSPFEAGGGTNPLTGAVAMLQNETWPDTSPTQSNGPQALFGEF